MIHYSSFFLYFHVFKFMDFFFFFGQQSRRKISGIKTNVKKNRKKNKKKKKPIGKKDEVLASLINIERTFTGLWTAEKASLSSYHHLLVT